MPDETTLIEALFGPYAGQRLTIPSADAKAAIKDGWARDPFAQPSNDDPKLPSDEQRFAATEAAEKAARKLRGGEGAEDNKAAKAPATAKAAEDQPHAASHQPETHTPSATTKKK
jgi:hypothetical protein